MKTLTANALAEIAKRYGTEPLNILEIEWEEGSVSLFADKADIGIKGKILSIGPVQTVLTEKNITTQTVDVSIDDTDGSIKEIVDKTDVHKKTATLYQYYGGLIESDKFIVFKGQISSPFSWGLYDRQFTFSIVNQIESYEIGFSPEEGQLEFVASTAIGVPWPLCFGDVVFVPAVRVAQKETATLLEPFGIVDPTLFQKLKMLEIAYNEEAVILKFWILVMTGANVLAPPVAWILDQLVKTILAEDALVVMFQTSITKLDTAKRIAERTPTSVDLKKAVKAFELEFQTLAKTINTHRLYKEMLYQFVDLATFEYELKKRAANEQINSYNRMRQIYFDYIDVQAEICRQKELVKSCVKVLDSELFPQSTDEAKVDVDVVLAGVKYRVNFQDNTMCYVAGPIGQYQTINVAPWQPDDDPCATIEEINSLNVFWLSADPPPNLEGMWLLVKKRGSPIEKNVRHIIKVEKQIGQKVYFNLVKWDFGGPGGQPRGISLQNIVGDIVATPFVPGPFGTAVPEGIFTGDLDPAIWNLPESKFLLKILAGIPGGVTREELEALTTLVFLLPSDMLSDIVIANTPSPQMVFTIIGEDVEEIQEASGIILNAWFDNHHIPYEEVPDSLSWMVPSGTPISTGNHQCEVYIANILPSTIKGVHAYRTNEQNHRFLAPVPQHYYIKNEDADLGALHVTALTFKQPLVSIPGEGWEEEVYVTLNSSVGPNVVDVIQWLIETYIPGYTVNAANFAAMKTKMENYPVNFALLERPNVLDEIYRIAWESRLAVLLRGSEFFLKYLSEEPDEDDTIEREHIEVNQFSIEYTPTEDLTTVLEASYDRNYLPLEGRQKKPRIVLRHNIAKYGVHKKDEHFHIFNTPDLVEKSATFWLIRRSNTWKLIRFNTFHTKIRLDTLDTVIVDIGSTDYANAPVKCIVQEAIYDSQNNTISLLCHTGIRAGEMEQYIHFWPALASESEEFPTAAEIEKGYAGGFGPGQNVTGTINDCPDET